MPTDLAIRCECGSLRGVLRGVSGANGNRIVCYCDDCQSFAHFLGRADQILDPHGGTDIFQTSPARLEISAGTDRLVCMRLTSGGLVRWYADCCKTPIGNTLATRQVPFVGMIHSCTDPASAGGSRNEAMGPIRARVHGRFATGDRSQLDAHDKAPASMLLRFASILVKARLRGDHARSPFFDAKTGALTATPRVLTAEDLLKVESARDAT